MLHGYVTGHILYTNTRYNKKEISTLSFYCLVLFIFIYLKKILVHVQVSYTSYMLPVTFRGVQ